MKPHEAHDNLSSLNALGMSELGRPPRTRYRDYSLYLQNLVWREGSGTFMNVNSSRTRGSFYLNSLVVADSWTFHDPQCTFTGRTAALSLRPAFLRFRRIHGA